MRSSPLCVPLSRKFCSSLTTLFRTPRSMFLTRHFSRQRRSRKTCRRGRTIPILITVKENILSNRNRHRRLIPPTLRNGDRRRNSGSWRNRHNYTHQHFSLGVGGKLETTPPKAPLPQSSSSPRGTSARRAMGTSTTPAETTTATTHNRSRRITLFIFF